MVFFGTIKITHPSIHEDHSWNTKGVGRGGFKAQLKDLKKIITTI